MKTFSIEKNKKQGIVLFVAALVAAIVLAIGIGTLNITLKELTLSAIGRESQVAFDAADAGLDCALFWDIRQGLTTTYNTFATSSGSANMDGSVECNGIALNNASGPFPGYVLSADASAATTTFMLSLDDNTNPSFPRSDAPCVEIVIAKYQGPSIDDPSATVPKTRIESRGMNTCDVSKAKRVQRGVEVSYEF